MALFLVAVPWGTALRVVPVVVAAPWVTLLVAVLEAVLLEVEMRWDFLLVEVVLVVEAVLVVTEFHWEVILVLVLVLVLLLMVLLVVEPCIVTGKQIGRAHV